MKIAVVTDKSREEILHNEEGILEDEFKESVKRTVIKALKKQYEVTTMTFDEDLIEKIRNEKLILYSIFVMVLKENTDCLNFLHSLKKMEYLTQVQDQFLISWLITRFIPRKRLRQRPFQRQNSSHVQVLISCPLWTLRTPF